MELKTEHYGRIQELFEDFSFAYIYIVGFLHTTVV